MAKKRSNRKILAKVVFFLYCMLMLWLLFFRSGGWIAGLTYEQQLLHNFNLTPFLTIKNYWTVVLEGAGNTLFIHCVINLLGNIFLFIPIGYLMPVLWKKLRNYIRFFCACFCVMFLIEILQLFTLLGSFDVDDLILNLFGMSIGFVVYHLFN